MQLLRGKFELGDPSGSRTRVAGVKSHLPGQLSTEDAKAYESSPSCKTQNPELDKIFEESLEDAKKGKIEKPRTPFDLE